MLLINKAERWLDVRWRVEGSPTSNKYLEVPSYIHWSKPSQLVLDVNLAHNTSQSRNVTTREEMLKGESHKIIKIKSF